jgi:hypothetical protein
MNKGGKLNALSIERSLVMTSRPQGSRDIAITPEFFGWCSKRDGSTTPSSRTTLRSDLPCR